MDSLEKTFNTFYLNSDGRHLDHCDDLSLPADDVPGVKPDAGSAISGQVMLPDPTSSPHVSVLVHSIPDSLKDRILLQIHGPNGTPSYATDAIQLLPAFQIITDFSVTLADEQTASLCTERGFSCISDDPEEATDLTVSRIFLSNAEKASFLLIWSFCCAHVVCRHPGIHARHQLPAFARLRSK